VRDWMARVRPQKRIDRRIETLARPRRQIAPQSCCNKIVIDRIRLERRRIGCIGLPLANTLHGGNKFLAARLAIRRQLCAGSEQRQCDHECRAQNRFAGSRHGDIMVVE
jgi:hypothetical protein